MVKTEVGTEQKVGTLVEGIFDAIKSVHELSERTDPIAEVLNKHHKYVQANFHSATLKGDVGDLQRNFSELKTAIQEHGELLEELKKLILSNQVHRNEHLKEVVQKKRKTH